LAKTKSKPATVPVLLPLALPAPYDYLVPDGMEVAPGQFVVAPLGTVEYLACVWHRGEGAEAPAVAAKKLREIIEVLDDVPPLPRISLDFADWVARYTLSSPGMVLRMMMGPSSAYSPPAPRHGVRLAGHAAERLTPARARVLAVAGNGLTWVKSALAEEAGVSPGVIDGLVDAGTLITEELPAWTPQVFDLSPARARLTHEQAEAADDLLQHTSEGFSVTLLDGVTGSGKTEVYFEAIAAALAKGKQALVLMPEIALTSQFIARCEERFGARPAEWHSGLSSPVRGRVWRAVAQNEAKLVVGARSALFLPFPDLGLIIVDEEHDQLGEREPRPLPPHPTWQALQSGGTAGHRGHRHARQPARARALAVAGSGRCGCRDAEARRAGIAVPEPPRLCARDVVPELRLQIRMPELLGLARRAPLPPQA
jgi:primosomal protein N' (replication factor Y)